MDWYLQHSALLSAFAAEELERDEAGRGGPYPVPTLLNGGREIERTVRRNLRPYRLGLSVAVKDHLDPLILLPAFVEGGDRLKC